MSTTVPRTPSPARLEPPGALRVGAVAAGVAVVANLLVLLAGRAAGADAVVGRAGAAQTVGALPVVVATIAGITAGTLLLLVLRRRGHRAWTAVAVAGPVLALATTPAPWSMAPQPATRVTLVAMHVLTGLVWFVLVRRAARRRDTTPPGPR